jgi:hypothetical protein
LVRLVLFPNKEGLHSLCSVAKLLYRGYPVRSGQYQCSLGFFLTKGREGRGYSNFYLNGCGLHKFMCIKKLERGVLYNLSPLSSHPLLPPTHPPTPAEQC